MMTLDETMAVLALRVSRADNGKDGTVNFTHNNGGSVRNLNMLEP